MKRSTALLLALSILFSSFIMTGCMDKKDDSLETELISDRDEITEVLNNSKTNKDVRKYLLSWASENGIKASYDEFYNVIFSRSASEGYENADSNIFQCTVDLENIEQTSVSMAIAENIIKSETPHGFIRVIFTSPGGTENIVKTYITGDNFINLDHIGKNSILVGSAGSIYYTMTRTLSYKNPSYTHAYRLLISGMPEFSISDPDTHPNIISRVGDLIANAKSKNILVEIAEFNAGISADMYPSSLSCTLIVNQNDIEKFTKRVRNVEKKLRDKYIDDDDENFSFEFIEVPLPEKVISYEDASMIISFLYTCLDGNYLKDDAGELIARSNIGKVSTDNGIFKADICAKSKSKEVLDEMQTIYNTICSLSEMSFEKQDGDMIWDSNTPKSSDIYSEKDTLNTGEASDNPLISSLCASHQKICGKKAEKIRTMSYSACAEAAGRVPDMNVAAYSINIDHMDKSLITLLDYLESGNI